jgi:hypothetical protein
MHDVTEVAYKNGYNQAIDDAIKVIVKNINTIKSNDSISLLNEISEVLNKLIKR